MFCISPVVLGQKNLKYFRICKDKMAKEAKSFSLPFYRCPFLHIWIMPKIIINKSLDQYKL